MSCPNTGKYFALNDDEDSNVLFVRHVNSKKSSPSIFTLISLCFDTSPILVHQDEGEIFKQNLKQKWW